MAGEALPVNGLQAGVTLLGADAANTVIDGEFTNANAPVVCPASQAGAHGVYVYANTLSDNRADNGPLPR